MSLPQAHLRLVHPGHGGGPPSQGVAAEAQEGPGQEVAPSDQVEEEEVHHDPPDQESQHYGQPQRTTYSALDLLTELRLPLQQSELSLRKSV